MKPVVIIGAGPAGLACAGDLVEGGRQVILVDDNNQAGGQYFRQLPPGYVARPRSRLLRDKARYDKLAAALNNPKITMLNRTTAWGAPDTSTIAYAGPHGSGRIEASAVVIANGAQDKPFPFPGWTLPGVLSAGGCLNLAKAHGLVPGGKVVIAGNGPLVLVAAATMITAGADVVGVIEAQSNSRLLKPIATGVHLAPGILATAIDYHRRILASGNRVRTGWMLYEAAGNGGVERVAIAPVGHDGTPQGRKKIWIDADTVVSGYGLIPSSEFARIMGCQMEYREDLGGLVPVRSAQMSTSVQGVYAVGDGAGIGGVEVALLEGRIAACHILGSSPGSRSSNQYDRLDRFRRKLNLAYLTANPLRSTDGDTIVCRCEELRLKELLADPSANSGDLDRLKTSSRLGMGRCQGRNCLPGAATTLKFTTPPYATHPRSRPPARPVPLYQLAADAHAGEAKEPDEQHAQIRSSK